MESLLMVGLIILPHRGNKLHVNTPVKTLILPLDLFSGFRLKDSITGQDSKAVKDNNCPSSEWSSMCRPCCEYHLIQCRCPSQGSRVGYTVPCCRNALDQCDPCIYHPGCSLFENCKSCHNGTWRANDDFFIRGRFCTTCRQGWSGGDCKTCGGVIHRAQGHLALESYPINARCEWRVQAQRGHSIELRFSKLSLEPDYNCRYDYIEVRDGDSLNSPVIGRFCGDQLPPSVKSSRNVLHILFVSDGYGNFDGFVLIFQENSVSSTGPVSRDRCARPPKVLNGFYQPAPDAVGSTETIEFFCKNSYILSGNQRSTCLSNGSWSSWPPKCVRACREPKVSELVKQKVVKPHPASSFLPHTLDKQSRREDAPVEELPRGFHQLHTSIEYQCSSSLYRHSGSSRRTCLKTGKWSGRHVSCSPVCGKVASLSPHNLTDAEWPWHVAVYIRSPSRHSDTERDVVLPLSDQQRPSEESMFWSLACSGALLTHRSVLVAAHCVVEQDEQQPLQPAHVKVIVGVGPSRGKANTLQHLRVSNILVHPNFYSASDSDLAVLKLTDKAKISEHVLPVCLPRMQGGEVMAQEAYTARWTAAPSRYTHSGQIKLVELADVAQCEKAFAERGAHGTMISDNVMCVIRKASGPDSPCPSVIPGITTVPSVASSASAGLSRRNEAPEAAGVVWEVLGLESFNYQRGNCHQDVYTGQTRIVNFRNWIEENMK
ncbi:inactive serine protease PAMR1 [Diretmus argenteus]